MKMKIKYNPRKLVEVFEKRIYAKLAEILGWRPIHLNEKNYAKES